MDGQLFPGRFSPCFFQLCSFFFLSIVSWIISRSPNYTKYWIFPESRILNTHFLSFSIAIVRFTVAVSTMWKWHSIFLCSCSSSSQSILGSVFGEAQGEVTCSTRRCFSQILFWINPLKLLGAAHYLLGKQ